VAKLIDTSKCIGCKACQVACLDGTTCASRWA
jgi:Fe-S-cluster-containing dehydrogenase component